MPALVISCISDMKNRLILLIAASFLLAACQFTEHRLSRRAQELCRYVPVPEQLEISRNCLTPEFYAALDTMFNLPDTSDILHEWEFWFCAADGSPISRCSVNVQSVQCTDDCHAVAVIAVQPEDQEYESEQHTLIMQRAVDGWLLADFDDRFADCIRYTQNARKLTGQ